MTFQFVYHCPKSYNEDVKYDICQFDFSSDSGNGFSVYANDCKLHPLTFIVNKYKLRFKEA